MALRLLAGTSGFSYAAWKGPFYPPKLAAKEMLRYYAEHLPIVEINNTFYRLPSIAMLDTWAAQVPETFRFAIKAPRRITHIKRLADCAAETDALLAAVGTLGERLASVLFQTPPFLRADVTLLERFVGVLPQGLKAAFEFRHVSWLQEPVLALLGERNFALAISETDERAVDLPRTADWAYLRLRKTSYTSAELAGWLARLRAARLTEAQVFFKHEERGIAPKLALEMLGHSQ